MLAKKLDGNKVKCLACRRYCVLGEGQAGFCGVRWNDCGRMVLGVYGRAAAVCVDSVEKKPLFHFLPGSTIYSVGTFGCNFACSFCQNWDLSQAPQAARELHPVEWRNYFENIIQACSRLSPAQAVEGALAAGCKSIAFTYNEPTIFAEYALDVMKLARRKGLKGVFVTNGFESPECWKAIWKGIDAVNIDLKSFSDGFYGKTCKALGGLEAVKSSIALAKKLGLWVEVTTLLIPGQNDSAEEIMQAAEWLASVDEEMPWHVTAFHPDYKMNNVACTPYEKLVEARKVGLQAGLKHVYCGNVSSEYSNCETTFCAKCGKELIRRQGFEVTENNVEKGKCAYCKYKVKGIWN